jgi:hypothetical protein
LLLRLAKMLNKLLSFHRTFVSRNILLTEVIENAHGSGRFKYIVNKCQVCSPLGGYEWKFRDFHVCGPRKKSEDRRVMYASLPARDDGTDGEEGVDIDSVIRRCV